MNCRICGCEIEKDSQTCSVCSVNILPKQTYSAAENKRERTQLKKKKLIFCILLPIFCFLLIGAAVLGSLTSLKSIREGTWLDGHFELKDAEIQLNLTENYTRRATEEQASTTEAMICDLAVGTVDSATQMYLYRVDLTKGTIFGVLVSEDAYLDLLSQSFESDISFQEYGMLQQGGRETVTVADKEFLSVTYKGNYTNSLGEQSAIYERLLVRREGKTILFIDIASSESLEAVENLQSLLVKSN